MDGNSLGRTSVNQARGLVNQARGGLVDPIMLSERVLKESKLAAQFVLLGISRVEQPVDAIIFTCANRLAVLA
jgi:hypothetical protein